MTAKDQLRQLVAELPETAWNDVDLNGRIERVRLEAEQRGLPGNPLEQLTHLLQDHPFTERLERLARNAEAEAPGQTGEAFMRFLATLMKEPQLCGELIEAFLRALYLVSVPDRKSPTVTFREVATRLKDLPLPGDGFAEDLEAVHAAQPRVGNEPWPS